MSEILKTDMTGKRPGPDTSPMNLTLATNPTAQTVGEVYTVVIQDLAPGSAPLQTPNGSTPVVPADGSITYEFQGTLPNGQPFPGRQLNGAGVLIYKTP
jgi:hypothetical protein